MSGQKINKSAKISVFCLFFLFLAQQIAHSQSVLDADFTATLLKGSALGMGGAYRAMANDNQAILWNPAGIMQNRNLSISADWMSGDFQNIDLLGGAVTDTRSEDGFGLAVAYDRTTQQILGNDVDYQQFTLAAATTLLPGLMLGMSGKYYMSAIATPLFNGPDGFTMDVGALWYLLNQRLSLATTVQNFIEGTSNPNVPLLVSSAVAFRPNDQSLITMDVVQDFSTNSDTPTNFYWGAQALLSEDFVLRTGYGLDRVRDNPFVSAGLVVTAPRAWLGFTYARRLDPGQDILSVFLELRM